jgi:hypothetical protein
MLTVTPVAVSSAARPRVWASRAVLGARVGVQARNGAWSGGDGAGDVDDAAVALLDHLVQEGEGQAYRAGQVDRDGPCPVLRLDGRGGRGRGQSVISPKPWPSPSTLSRRAILGPATGYFQMPARTVRPCHGTSRGMPTFTDSSDGMTNPLEHPGSQLLASALAEAGGQQAGQLGVPVGDE